MKKVLKGLSLAFVFLALAIVPLLAGCSKTYTVDVSITGGNQNGGFVTYHGGLSVYGKTAVEEGEDFVFSISPKNGYYIHEIKIDGKVYEHSFNKNGYTLTLENISANRDVEVTFAPIDGYTVSIYVCKYNEGGQNVGFEQYKTLKIKLGEKLTLTEFGENNSSLFYYVKKSNNERVFINTTNGVEIFNNFDVFTLKSAEELNELIEDNQPAE